MSLRFAKTRIYRPFVRLEPRLIHPFRLQCFSTSPFVPNSKPETPKPPPSPFHGQDEPLLDPSAYEDLPQHFGENQQMQVEEALRERLRSVLWQFRAPIRYAIAYGSGVFSQGAKDPTQKPQIDMIFGVTYTQHWHSLNLHQHPNHYSFMGTLGSAAVAYVQDRISAGVYFNPYVEVNGTIIKYGVVNIDTLCRDLADWDTLYLAGRMHKPVKILRDHPRVRLAAQINLMSAVRVALLLLPDTFSEQALYSTIAGISYLGDPRMKLFSENPHKVHNIVANNVQNFRRLYSPLIEQLPNVAFQSQMQDEPADTVLVQDMDPVRRGNMVRRLPKAFREKLYFQYQRKYQIPTLEFEKMVGLSEDDERMKRKLGGEFEQRIAGDIGNIREEAANVIKSTISWPSTSQSIKGIVSAGPIKSWRYMGEKVQKWREAKKSPRKKDKEEESAS